MNGGPTPERSKLQAEFDQSSAAMADHFPPLWRRMYLETVKVGFSETQAFDILQTYIVAVHSRGILGPGT